MEGDETENAREEEERKPQEKIVEQGEGWYREWTWGGFDHPTWNW